MKISKREIILLVVIFFVISAAAYYYYFLTPVLTDIDNLNVTIEQKKMKILSMQTSIDQIDNVKNEIAELTVELAKQSENIPQGISQPLQLVAITNVLNNKSGSKVISFVQKKNTFENYQKNSANLSISTTYENLLLILQEFNDLSMMNQIVKMSVLLSPGGSTYYTGLLEGSYLSVEITVEFYSFYANPNAEPMERQAFEDSPIEHKSPFKATLN